MGKSRGGITTKIHAISDGLGRCIDFSLTEGQVHDSTQAEALLKDKKPENVIADKAYDSNAIREQVSMCGANAVIPSNSSRKVRIEHDAHLYKERHLVENFFQFIKRYRRVGTRYEMSARNYAGMVMIACILQWLIF